MIADWKTNSIIVIKVLLVLMLSVVGETANLLLYLLLMGWALRGPRFAIEALTLLWLTIFLNPGIFSLHDYGELLRWLVIGAGFFSVALSAVNKKITVPKSWLWVLFFIIIISVLSFYTSHQLTISIFRLLSFLMVATIVLLGFHLTRHDYKYWQKWFLFFFATVVIVGFPFIFNELGYYKNQRSFQGLTNHAQVYAVFLAPFLSWLIVLFYSKYLRHYFWILIIAIASVSLFFTDGRTGALALGMGLLFPFIGWLIRYLKTTTINHSTITVLSLLVVLLSIVIIINWEPVYNSTVDFVLDRRAEHTIPEAVRHSREDLIVTSLRNFYQYPIYGVGFGADSNYSVISATYDPIFGLPVSNSGEKGFVISAVLEETGIIGFALFIILLLSLLRPAFIRSMGYPEVALAGSAFFTNFGEYTFFAFGGTGILVWLLIGAARVIAEEREKERILNTGQTNNSELPVYNDKKRKEIIS